MVIQRRYALISFFIPEKSFWRLCESEPKGTKTGGRAERGEPDHDRVGEKMVAGRLGFCR